MVWKTIVHVGWISMTGLILSRGLFSGLILSFSMLLPVQTIANNFAKIDSLKRELRQGEERETLDILNELSGAYRTLDPEKSLRYGQLAIDLAERLQKPKGHADALVNVRNYYWDKNDFRKALDYSNEALKYYEQILDESHIARTQVSLGKIYEDLSQSDQALDYLLRALMIFEDINDQKEVASTITYISDIYEKWGQHDKALRFQERAYAIYSDYAEIEGAVRSLTRIGHILLIGEDYAGAEERFLSALQLCEDSGNISLLALCYSSLGDLYYRQDNYSEALTYFIRALELEEKTDNPKSIAVTLNQIADLYKELGNSNRAIDYYNRALTHVQVPGLESELFHILLQKGKLYVDLGNRNRAIQFLNQGLQVALNIRALELIQEAYLMLAQAYEIFGESEKALENHQLFQETRDKIHLQQSSQRIAELEIRYELDKKNAALNLMKQESLLQEMNYQKKSTLMTSILSFSFVLFILLIIFVIYRQRLIRKGEREKLENVLRLKADFTAMLVHDLRSPLTSVFGYAELLKMEQKAPEKIKDIADTIIKASQKMLMLVNDMLDFSKLEAGKMNISRDKTNLAHIVSSSIQMLQPIAEKHKSEVSFYCADDLPDCFCDERKIEQVITNFISNAIGHTPEGSKISVNLQKVEIKGKSFIEFSVEDNGEGMSPEFQKTIFDKYAQMDLKGKEINLGTGLGLAVSRMIIEAHGGEIGYRPASPNGSIFYFRLEPLSAHTSE